MTQSSVDADLLMVLHAVLDSGSVSDAARRLHVTQSAVSNSLARLRELLDDPLLVRSGRKLVPTPRAARMAPLLAAAAEQLKTAVVDPADADPSLTTRQFVFASIDTDALASMPNLVEEVRAVLPRAGLRIANVDHALATDGLATGLVDLMLGATQMPLDYHCEELFEVQSVCVRRAGPHEPLDLEQFLALDQIQVALESGRSMDAVEPILARIGRQRRVALSVSSFTGAAYAAAGTDLVAVMPDRIARTLSRSLPLHVSPAPLPLPPRKVMLIWHARTHNDAACTLLRETFIRLSRVSFA
jgi:DNA-binding transcriptional LysR family regulator